MISNFSDRPSEDFHRKKLLLNEEFHNKSKIQGLVSYIYYPTQREYPLFGHAELEIEGCSYTLMTQEVFKINFLHQMIKSSESGHGFPFFRFQISVTPSQLKNLRENSLTTWGPICSMGVAKALSRQGKFTIPLPVAFSPCVSAIYLICVKKLSLRRVNCIEFHGGKDNIINIAKCIAGVAMESSLILSLILTAYRMCASKII